MMAGMQKQPDVTTTYGGMPLTPPEKPKLPSLNYAYPVPPGMSAKLLGVGGGSTPVGIAGGGAAQFAVDPALVFTVGGQGMRNNGNTNLRLNNLGATYKLDPNTSLSVDYSRQRKLPDIYGATNMETINQGVPAPRPDTRLMFGIKTQF